MILSGPDSLLFIEPASPASETPVIDALTRKMVAAYRSATREDITYCGFHRCVCGSASTPYNSVLPSGLVTNSLCVHYLAHHRDEVPAGELAKVAGLDCGEAEPTHDELWGMRIVAAESQVEEGHADTPLSGDAKTGKKKWWRFWR